MKNLVIINGTMGVGKSAVSKELNKKLNNSVWLDGDWCWMMDPFVVNDSTKSMVVENITFMLRNFLKQDLYENIIFSWVIDEEYIYDLLLIPLNDLCFNLYKITLMCTEQNLAQRHQKDVIDGVRTIGEIDKGIGRMKKYELLSSDKVDTNGKNIKTIVNEIIAIIDSRQS